MRARTEVWNAFVADLARQSSYTRLVALDLFTTMECVFNQPADFGFTNVTQVRPQGADAAKYLFDLNDDIHFGQRGQVLIRHVVRDYLTRGWDWSNTDKNPGTARQKLVADLEAARCSPASLATSSLASALAEPADYTAFHPIGHGRQA